MLDKNISQLIDILNPDHFTINKTDLISVSHDESSLDGVIPELLIYPETSQEISNIIKFCYKNEIKITTRGAGTSLEGNSIPVKGGIVLDLSKMKQIIELRENDLQISIQPGIIYKELNDFLKPYGLFFPPSPGGSSDIATIGGMVSTNASGIYSVKYGGTRDYVLKLKIITGTGEVIDIGNHCVKSSSGYHLVGLLCGSEGTLGIITEITLKLKGLPENYKKIAYSFPEENKAVSAITEMIKYGLDISAVEYLDRHCISALNNLKSYGLEENPVIFLELQGSEESIESTLSYINTICNDYNAKELILKNNQNPWEIRHHTTTSIKLLKKDHTIIRNDIAFPISKLSILVEKCYDLAKEYNLLVHTFGHVGLGILHVLILADKNNKTDWNNAQKMNETIIEYAINLNGSTSGEHGIGISLKKFMEKEHGKALDLMIGIKKVFDPKNILNPDKIFPNQN